MVYLTVLEPLLLQMEEFSCILCINNHKHRLSSPKPEVKYACSCRDNSNDSSPPYFLYEWLSFAFSSLQLLLRPARMPIQTLQLIHTWIKVHLFSETRQSAVYVNVQTPSLPGGRSRRPVSIPWRQKIYMLYLVWYRHTVYCAYCIRTNTNFNYAALLSN